MLRRVFTRSDFVFASKKAVPCREKGRALPGLGCETAHAADGLALGKAPLNLRAGRRGRNGLRLGCRKDEIRRPGTLRRRRRSLRARSGRRWNIRLRCGGFRWVVCGFAGFCQRLQLRLDQKTLSRGRNEHLVNTIRGLADSPWQTFVCAFYVIGIIIQTFACWSGTGRGPKSTFGQKKQP